MYEEFTKKHTKMMAYAYGPGQVRHISKDIPLAICDNLCHMDMAMGHGGHGGVVCSVCNCVVLAACRGGLERWENNSM